jgi:hypothetical protein
MGVLKLLERTAASVSTPSAGKSALFIDSADGLLKFRDDAGNLTVVLGNTADLSAFIRTLLDDANALAARNTLGVSPRYRFHAWTECTQGQGAGLNIDGAGSGTGASRNVIANASTSEFGVVRWMSGTTTSGRNNLSGAVNLFPILLGQGVTYLYVRQAVPTLSTGAETFTLRWGFIDSVTGESTNGVFFRYTDSVNSGKWQAVTRNAGVETATDTGVTEVAGTFRKFEITVNAAATSVEFKIDGAVVATNITNIPSGVGKDVTYGGMSLKSAGTTSVAMCDIDTVEVTVDFTTPR